MQEENLEIERKFLVENVTEELLRNSFATSLIYQTYLYSDDNREERIRKATKSGFKKLDSSGTLVYMTDKEYDENSEIGSLVEETTYTFTEKIGHGKKRIENEKEISINEYLELLKKKDSNTLYKTRYSFMVENTEEVSEVIIDTYTITDFIVAEIEYKSDKTDHIPQFLQDIIVKEVTGKKEYSNKKLAYQKD